MVVPAETPVTKPADELTVATEALLLLHVPPGMGSVRLTAAPEQTVAGPVIEPPPEETITVFVADDDPQPPPTE
jgi:hypothetical protein